MIDTRKKSRAKQQQGKKGRKKQHAQGPKQAKSPHPKINLILLFEIWGNSNPLPNELMNSKTRMTTRSP